MRRCTLHPWRGPRWSLHLRLPLAQAKAFGDEALVTKVAVHLMFIQGYLFCEREEALAGFDGRQLSKPQRSPIYFGLALVWLELATNRSELQRAHEYYQRALADLEGHARERLRLAWDQRRISG